MNLYKGMIYKIAEEKKNDSVKIGAGIGGTLGGTLGGAVGFHRMKNFQDNVNYIKEKAAKPPDVSFEKQFFNKAMEDSGWNEHIRKLERQSIRRSTKAGKLYTLGEGLLIGAGLGAGLGAIPGAVKHGFDKLKKPNNETKVASLKQTGSLEKLATRSWKVNLANLGSKSLKKLERSGVLDREKELAGLTEGSDNLIKKLNIKEVSPEEAAKNIYDMEQLLERPSIADNYERILQRDALARSLKSSGPAAVMRDYWSSTVGEKVLPKNIQRLYQIVNTQRGSKVFHEPLFSMNKVRRLFKSKKQEFADKYTNQLDRRHEIDEIRAKFKDKDFSGKYGYKTHHSPEVLFRESANVAMAPKTAKKDWIKMRNSLALNRDFMAYDPTLGLKAIPRD